jgi:hypothetical protein
VWDVNLVWTLWRKDQLPLPGIEIRSSGHGAHSLLEILGFFEGDYQKYRFIGCNAV